MNAIILSIGDELVLGQTIDTNSAWLSQQLATIGCAVRAHLTVGDDQRAVEQTIQESVGRCDYLIITGGLGPTEDDLTRQALASVMDVPLEIHQPWIEKLHEFFRARGREMPPSNRIQAMIPRGAQIIDNTAGTAPGIHAIIGEDIIAKAAPNDLYFRIDAHPSDNPKSQIPNRKCEIFVLPGVPNEMKRMFMRDILQKIKKAGCGGVILSRTLHTFGVGESALGERLGSLMRRNYNPSVGTTVANGLVSLRINAQFNSLAKAEEELNRTTEACRLALGDLIFGQDDQTLAEVVAQLLRNDALANQFSPAVATAESCTGGLLAKMLTDVPGSSEYFRQGYVTYHNDAKIDLLNIPKELIAQHGAVSEPVVAAMAKGTQKQAGTPYVLAVSGIAGPQGGTPEKPVGTVCIALAHGQGLTVRTFQFSGDRETIRDRAAKMALSILRYRLLGKSMPF